ncbi:MAG TPA: hypothetical protein DCM27_07830 [Rhodospirillaceae bacterium]|nr:hypothetical protein [Rhodospirillaceae bacterium]
MIILTFSILFTMLFLVGIYLFGYVVNKHIVIKALVGMGGITASLAYGLQALLNIVNLGLLEYQNMVKTETALEKIKYLPDVIKDAFLLARNNCPEGVHIYLLIGAFLVLSQGFEEMRGCITLKRSRKIP